MTDRIKQYAPIFRTKGKKIANRYGKNRLNKETHLKLFFLQMFRFKQDLALLWKEEHNKRYVHK